MLLEYKSESETSTGSALPLYTLPTPIDLPPAYNNMSQINLYEIIHQQQEQLAAMQVQIQALLAGAGAGAGSTERGMAGSNMGPQMEVAKPAIFNGKAERVGGFVIAYRLYLRMKMKKATVKEQVQWVLSYVQEGSVDVWKENVMKELKTGKIEYKTVEEFLTSLKKEFGGGEMLWDIRTLTIFILFSFIFLILLFFSFIFF